MSHTRIIILQLKKLIYTTIFVALAILLLILLFAVFWPERSTTSVETLSQANQAQIQEQSQAKSQNQTSHASSQVDTAANASGSENSSGKYQAGVYTAEMVLGETTINLQVALDTDHIKSVDVINMEKSVATMYPLVKPAVKMISKQLANDISLEEVVLSEDSPYTQQLILETLRQMIDQAEIK